MLLFLFLSFILHWYFTLCLFPFQQSSVKMEEQGPRRPIQRERLESKGKRSLAAQDETFRDLLPCADLCEIKMEAEEGQPQQHWDAQWLDFLKTMHPPRSSWETPQAPSPPHSGDGVLPASFRGAADYSQWTRRRAGETDQTLPPDTEGLPEKVSALLSPGFPASGGHRSSISRHGGSV